MNKLIKRAAVLCAAGTMCLTTLAGCGNGIKSDEVVATVGEDDITLGTANFFARLQQASYETYYAGMMGMTGEEMWNQIDETGNSYEVSVKDGLMDNLTTMVILRQHASEYNISISDEDKEAIDKAADEFMASNSEDILDEISGNKESIEELLELMTIQQRMHEAITNEADVEGVEEEEAASTKENYFNDKVTSWKSESEISIDDEAWDKVDFNKIGFTMKEDN